MIPKYYFIVYQWNSPYRKTEIFKVENDVIDIHPLDWLLTTRGNVKDEIYRLVNWILITEEQYNSHKGNF